MKKIVKNLLLALVVSVASLPAVAQYASPTNFAPTPTSDSEPLRFFVNLQGSSMFGLNQTTNNFDSNGKFALMNGQLSLGVIYNVFTGFDVGLGLHGGMYSPYGMFVTPSPALTGDYKQYGMMFGADLMVRYIAMLSDMFYAGLQVQAGYNYTNTNPGAADSVYTSAKWTSATSAKSFIPMVVGIPVGVMFGGTAVYLFPALEMGQTPNQTNSTANVPSTPNTGIWKSALGFQVGVGTAIDLGGAKLVIQATPRMANFSNSSSWGLDATIGTYFDF